MTSRLTVDPRGAAVPSRPPRRVRRAVLSAAALIALLCAAGSSAQAAEPPDGRVYEMVSPVDKNGGNAEDRTSRVAPSGNAVSYGSPVGFPGSDGAASPSNYFARRTDGGWVTEALLPRFTNPGQTSATGIVRSVSADVSRALLAVPESVTIPGWMPPLDPNAPVGCPGNILLGSFCINLYLRQPAGFQLAHSASLGIHGSGNGNAGGTPDYGQFLFESANVQAPGPPDDGVEKLYEWDHGTIRYVGIDPEGNPFPVGTATSAGMTTDNTGVSRVRSRPMSADGRRIYFTAAGGFSTGPGQIYMREDAQRTFHVTQSEKTTPDPPQPAEFIGATPDGASALFTTTEDLVDGDSQPGRDLYLYRHSGDPDNDSNLTLVSRDDEPGDGIAAEINGNFQDGAPGGVVGMSDDGSKVYFASAGQLVAGEDQAPERKLYLWDHSDGTPTLTFVAGVDTLDGDSWQMDAYSGASTPPLVPARLPVEQVTPDGEHAVFLTGRALVPAQDGDSDRDVYRYGAAADGLVCVSCQPPGTPSAGPAGLRKKPVDGVFVAPSRNVAADGGRVFFESADPLVSGDANGKIDVYLWEQGELDLVSTGQSGSNSRFLGATASGDDVFFLTREKLSGWDVDNSVDLYDARVPRPGDAVLPEPPADHGCALDCQAEPAGRPALIDPASVGLRGLGDLPARTRASFSARGLGRAARVRLAGGRRARLRVRVSGAGRVSVVGRARLGGRERVVIRSSRRSRGKGTVTLALRLSGPARKRLAQGSPLGVALAVRFSGAPEVQRSRLSLRRPGRGG
jgi:hypothetical protein